MGLRKLANENPAVGWGVAVVLAIIAVFLAFRVMGGGTDVHSVEKMSQEITIRDIETGETWVMNRGRMEVELYQRAHQGTIDPDLGFINPNTGKATGFPDFRDSWEEMINRIEEDVEETKAKRGR